jgi:hypothetical protein
MWKNRCACQSERHSGTRSAIKTIAHSRLPFGLTTAHFTVIFSHFIFKD